MKNKFEKWSTKFKDIESELKLEIKQLAEILE